MSDFYVYEHVRRDTGAVFYVGKGTGARASEKRGRNPHWRNVVEKTGFQIRYVAMALDDELALLAEVERISQLRRLGVRLVNMTDGGDGMAGHIKSAESREKVRRALTGKAKTEAHRRRLSEVCKGRTLSEETKRKIGARAAGLSSSMRGKNHRPESIRKISAAVAGEKNPFFGKTHSLEAMDKIRAANLGRTDSDATRARKSKARQGALNPRWGVQIPDEQKQRQRVSLFSRPRVTCPHCNKTMDESNAKRWHFDNCKETK